MQFRILRQMLYWDVCKRPQQNPLFPTICYSLLTLIAYYQKSGFLSGSHSSSCCDMCNPMPPSQDWGESRFLNDTNDVQFLCRCSACLGGCGATASQTKGERRGPDAGEALPAKDCPAEPPVPSYTQLTASSAEAPSEGNSTSMCVCGRPVYSRCRGKKVESFPKYSMLEPNWMSNQLT